MRMHIGMLSLVMAAGGVGCSDLGPAAEQAAGSKSTQLSLRRARDAGALVLDGGGTTGFGGGGTVSTGSTTGFGSGGAVTGPSTGFGGLDGGENTGSEGGVVTGSSGGFFPRRDGGFGGRRDAGIDGGTSGGFDGGPDGGFDAGPDGGPGGGFDAGPDGGPGQQPVGDVIENNLNALGALNLDQALSAVGSNAGLLPAGRLLYQSLIDSYASSEQARMERATHCGDESGPDAPTTLNGYPIDCDRIETAQIGNLDEWFAIAALNRLDLAPVDGSHCGQQRLIFANTVRNGNSRIFMILEAQIPNPSPECGAVGCQPLAEAWDRLAQTPNPVQRGNQIVAMFIEGDAQLESEGFGPFLNADNMTVGSGQIRTNNFNDNPWTLREFKVVADEGGALALAVPFPVAESPHGRLWNDRLPLPQGPACRQNFLQAMDGLLTDDPAKMAFIVNEECKNSESRNDFRSEDYRAHLNRGSGAFTAAIAARLQGTGLRPRDIAARARFAGSCIGCHEESNGAALGNGVSAPFSAGFTHVSEQFRDRCDNGRRACSGLSSAMRDVFLPQRKEVQRALLSATSCEGTVPVDAGVEVSPLDGGGFAPSDFTQAPTPPLLTGDVTTEDLLQAEEQARAPLTNLMTLGGRPATGTH